MEHQSTPPSATWTLGVSLSLATIAFFVVVQKSLKLLPLPKAVAYSNTEYRKFRFRNFVISWLHAALTGVGAWICVILYGREMWADRVHFANMPLYVVTCFSAGYFLYDTIDIIVSGAVRQKWDVLIHHVALIFCAFYCVLSTTCMPYQVVAMTVELNTNFLHLRKIMQLAGYSPTAPFVQLNRLCNIVTFVPIRFGALFLEMYCVYTEDGAKVPYYFMLTFWAASTTLVTVNVILMYRVFSTDVRVARGKEE